MRKFKKIKILSSIMTVILAVSTIPAISAFAANKTESEPNNLLTTADTILVNDTYSAKISTASDVDCFKFVPSVDDVIRVDLTNIPSGKKYNLWLQNSSGNALTSNTATGTQKHITYEVTANTPYYIVINGSESSTGNYSDTLSYKVSLKSINFSYIPSTHYSNSTSISINTSELTSPYSSYFSTAMSNWHNAIDSVTFTSDSSSRNKIYVAEYDDEWLGLHIPYTYTSNGLFSRFELKINTATIDSATTTSNRANWYKSTMTHELGHTLGLEDNPSTNAESLMKHSRNRNSIITPQTFDIDAVKNKYGLASLTSNAAITNLDTFDITPNTSENLIDSQTEVYIKADYLEYKNVSELYKAADLVVVCSNTGNKSEMINISKNHNENLPYLISNLTITEVIKGDPNLDEIKIKQLGGTFNNIKYISDEVEYLNVNDSYLLFLKTYDNSPASILNPIQGIYHIDGTNIVSRNENSFEINLSELLNYQ